MQNCYPATNRIAVHTVTLGSGGISHFYNLYEIIQIFFMRSTRRERNVNKSMRNSNRNCFEKRK